MDKQDKDPWRKWPYYVGGYFFVGCIALHTVSDSFSWVTGGSGGAMVFAGLVWMATHSLVGHRKAGPLLPGKAYYFLLWLLTVGFLIYNEHQYRNSF